MNRGTPRRTTRGTARPQRYRSKGVLTKQRVAAWRNVNPRGLERLLRWLAVPLALFFAACSSPAPTPARAATLPATVFAAVRPPAEVIAFVTASGNRYCGGFAVGPAALLTAAHCFRGKSPGSQVAYVTESRWRETANGVYLATLERADTDRDLAWFSATPPLPYGDLREPAELEPVEATGSISDWALSTGYTTGPAQFRSTEAGFTYDDLAPARFWTSTLSIQPGWSGSPVVAADGAIVGVVVGCTGTLTGGLSTRGCQPGYTIFAPLTESDARP